jgi:HEPN domain-containing protein
VPFVVNAAFALELYLKTLGHLFGRALRGHDLLGLFDALPPEGHEVLRQNLSKAKWQCGITNMEGFRNVLSDLRSAFIEWRYLHEKDRASEISFIPMIFVMEVLHVACQANEKVHRASENP